MTLSVRLFPWAPLHLRNASAGRPDLLHVDVLDRLAARDCEGAVEAAEAWILARRESRSDDGLTAAIRRLYDAPEAAPLEALCDLAALSPRTLQRRMRAALGCTPKQLQRLARFQRASLALALDPAADLADLAYALGYADQPHFTREFSAFAGLSPTRFRRLLRR
jgi:AraC-like DNA-binding protein